MIPASWTDYVGVPQCETQRRQANQGSAVLASVSELLHARVVLAPVLARMQVADSSGVNPPEGESNAAATKLRTRVIGSSRAKSHSLVDTRGKPAKRDSSRSSASARKNGQSKSQRRRGRHGKTR